MTARSASIARPRVPSAASRSRAAWAAAGSRARMAALPAFGRAYGALRSLNSPTLSQATVASAQRPSACANVPGKVMCP